MTHFKAYRSLPVRDYGSYRSADAIKFRDCNECETPNELNFLALHVQWIFAFICEDDGKRCSYVSADETVLPRRNMILLIFSKFFLKRYRSKTKPELSISPSLILSRIRQVERG